MKSYQPVPFNQLEKGDLILLVRCFHESEWNLSNGYCFDFGIVDSRNISHNVYHSPQTINQELRIFFLDNNSDCTDIDDSLFCKKESYFRSSLYSLNGEEIKQKSVTPSVYEDIEPEIPRESEDLDVWRAYPIDLDMLERIASDGKDCQISLQSDYDSNDCFDLSPSYHAFSRSIEDVQYLANNIHKRYFLQLSIKQVGIFS